MSYNLNKPMTFLEFKHLPKDLQEIYIEQLQKKFDASQRMISEMLGVSPYGFANYRTEHGLNVRFSKKGASGKKSTDQRQRWESFIHGDADCSATAETSLQAETVAHEPEQTKPKKEADSEAPRSLPKNSMQFDGFTLRFSDEFDRAAMLNSISAMLHDGQKVTLTISCEVVP